MNISSNTLFHFMQKPEYLLNILEHEFCPRFFQEDFDDLFPSLDRLYKFTRMGVPMVCFCDIPLSLINEHMDEYGNYGIGMKKEWAIKNGINPIIYAAPETTITRKIDKTISCYIENLKTKKDADFPTSEDFLDLIEIISHIKPYEGISKKSGSQKTFYDEREWRYIPPHDLFTDQKGIIYRFMRDEINSKDTIERANLSLRSKPFRLSFEPSDIKYLIVKDESEIYELTRMIDQCKSNFSHRDVTILKTRIITASEIVSDT